MSSTAEPRPPLRRRTRGLSSGRRPGPLGLLRSSLPLRVLVTTLASTTLLLGLAGYVLLQMTTAGIIEAKREAVVNEAVGVHAFMQQQLRGPTLRGVGVTEALNRLAEQVSAQTSQYQMVIHAPTSTLVSGGLAEESVPRSIIESVRAGDGLFLAPTEVRWVTGARSGEPGLVVGTTLSTANSERIPVYYVFPMTSELQVVHSIQIAVAITFSALLTAMALIVYLITWRAIGPVRRASATALRLASGNLSERMEVRGTDEIATLASSMNKMAEELQARIRQLESLSAVQRRFVSDVSHELRTPLTTIQMAAEVLHEAREEASPAQRRTIELMWSEIGRFDELLADLLEISRFDAGAAVLALDDHDFAQLVEDEIEAARPLATRQGIELRLRVLADDTRAEIDARRVRRVLRNLIGNAIDHGQGQPVDVTVAADDDTVAVTVRDHGVGFEAEQSAQVFERFWRADPSRTRVVGGTGLGLSISLEDAKLHRGWLNAWGRPGRGAQFRLTLPRGPEHRVLASPLPVAPSDEGRGR